ncbi:hypothetical protein HY523_01220 [Candidatus Berkelbacteria bacterium]|nr:hypothetical protein [Candidatus Berkelbacteria bacterium]
MKRVRQPAGFTPRYQKATGVNQSMTGYEIPKGHTPPSRLFSRGAGFTLIEFQVLLSFLGLFGVVALPTVTKPRETARLSSVMGGVRTTQVATEILSLRDEASLPTPEELESYLPNRPQLPPDAGYLEPSIAQQLDPYGSLSPTPTASGTSSPKVVRTTASPTPSSTATTSSPTPSASATTSSPTPTATATTSSPTPSSTTSSASPTASASPTSSATPTPTPTPTPTLTGYFQTSFTDVNLTITPTNVAGKSLTGIRLDLAATNPPLPTPVGSAINLNQTGQGASNWSCQQSGTLFQCSGATPLQQNLQSIFALYFAETLSSPPATMTVFVLEATETQSGVISGTGGIPLVISRQ